MLSTNKWLELSIETRSKLAEAFYIKKTSATEVVNNQVVCDGHSVLDLEVVTIENLQSFASSKSQDFYELFNIAVDIVEGRKTNKVINEEEIRSTT